VEANRGLQGRGAGRKVHCWHTEGRRCGASGGVRLGGPREGGPPLEGGLQGPCSRAALINESREEQEGEEQAAQALQEATAGS